MSRRTLFVRGISRTLDQEAFTKLVAHQKGVLKAFLVGGHVGHKGIGFVECITRKDAQRAMQELNGMKIGDHELKVEFAKERESFQERKKRKMQSLKTEEVDEKPFFETLGAHSRVRSIAIGGITTPNQLNIMKEEAESIGKVEHFTFPLPMSVVNSAQLMEDGCRLEVLLVTFGKVSAAMGAVCALHGKEMKNSEGGERIWCRQISGEGAQLHKNKIILRNLSAQVDEATLRELLSTAGFVWKLNIPRDGKGNCKGTGFAYFTTYADAQRAISSMHGQMVSGNCISVCWANAPSNPSRQTSDLPEITAPKTKTQEHQKLSKYSSTAAVEPSVSEISSKSDEAKQMLEIKSMRHAEPVVDVNEGLRKTLFLSGLALDIIEEDLKSHLEQFGPLKSVLIVKNKLTGKSKGTAFVEYVNVVDKEKALESINNKSVSGITIGKDRKRKIPLSFGLNLMAQQALSKDEVTTAVTKRKQEKVKADRRNLYLLNEGKIDEESQVWQSLTRTDQEIRKRSLKFRREKLKNPLFFISKTRLCLRNLPPMITEPQLRTLVIQAIQSRATCEDPKIRQAKLLYEDSNEGKSLQRGFVEFEHHEHALCALRALNANPELFGPQRRPIVEFAIDNKEVTNRRDQLIKRLKNEAGESGRAINDATFGFGKKKRKGRKERLLEKTFYMPPQNHQRKERFSEKKPVKSEIVKKKKSKRGTKSDRRKYQLDQFDHFDELVEKHYTMHQA